jgi:protocatechuate 3,4-dioxygenase beta subunit
LSSILKFRYAVALAFLVSQVLCAQTATLRGQITDESGAVIPGAKVTLSSPSGTAKGAVADHNGIYNFAAVTPGDYTVRASAPDLSLAQPAKVTLRAGSHTLNLVLRVASLSEKLTVQDTAAPALTTDSSNNARQSG